MRATELFGDVLPGIIRDHPERARGLSGSIVFDLSGPDGGCWTLDLECSPPSLTAGRAAAPACTVAASAEDFEKLLSDPAAALQLFRDNRVRVTGETTLATLLYRLFE